MQQEMVRLHRGEENRMEGMAERFFRPMWYKMQEVLTEGIASGELIHAIRIKYTMRHRGLMFLYFLSAPLVRLAFDFETAFAQ